MMETIRSAKALRALAAVLLAAVMCLGVFAVMQRSHAETNEEYCYNFCVNNMGLNTAAAAGLLANFEQESSFNPTLSGDSGSSYGLCQWNKDRKSALINYCNSHGMSYSTLYGQLSYLYYELQNEYPELLSTLRSTANTSNGAYNAGYRFCYDFERPASKESKSQSRGSSASRTYFPKYYGTTGNVATTTVSTTAATPAPTPTPVSNTQGNYVVTTGGSNLNVRSGPGTNYSAVAKVTDGTYVTVTQVSNGWGQVNVGGVSGWVSMDYLTKA
ncbi:MAG: SH3 domain-containing protein [Clostridia bacterium]|nr:SH3 domain-containing protein [Clostridia bacterium]